jgi:hypothetical protein
MDDTDLYVSPYLRRPCRGCAGVMGERTAREQERSSTRGRSRATIAPSAMRQSARTTPRPAAGSPYRTAIDNG